MAKDKIKDNDFEIIIPVFNEGNQFIFLLNELIRKITFNFSIIIAYDSDKDKTLQLINNFRNKNKIKLVKNELYGPNNAILSAIKKVEAKHFFVYMADDLQNINLINKIYKISLNSNHDYDLIIPSRFTKGGKMINCPFPKNVLVRTGNKIVCLLSDGITDATNAFKFFKTNSFNNINIKSKEGFTYALEATLKMQLNKNNIIETPAIWIERKSGKSNFKIIKWLPYYTYWLIYLFISRIIR